MQPLALTWLHICRDDLHIDARITETYRSPERQQALQAAGASDVKLGWHTMRRAFDFACYDSAGHYIKDGAHELYQRCGAVAVALGCRWPIKRANGTPDWCHVEHHPGFTLAQYQAALQEGIV